MVSLSLPSVVSSAAAALAFTFRVYVAVLDKVPVAYRQAHYILRIAIFFRSGKGDNGFILSADSLAVLRHPV